MDKRQKTGLFIIVLALLIIAAIIYFIFFRQTPLEPTPANPVASTTNQTQLDPVTSEVTPGDKPRNYQQYDISKEAEHEFNENDISKLSSAFAERLGSFSNQSNYSNFDDLNLFMTADMRDWAKSYVEKMRADNVYDGNYYGVTTKAVGTELKSFNDQAGNAEVIVSTQRREVKLDGSENNFQQKLRLTFLKQNNQWLVDGAYWEK